MEWWNEKVTSSWRNDDVIIQVYTTHLETHRWSPISTPSQGPTWYSHWAGITSALLPALQHRYRLCSEPPLPVHTHKDNVPWVTNRFTGAWYQSMCTMVKSLRNRLHCACNTTYVCKSQVWYVIPFITCFDHWIPNFGSLHTLKWMWCHSTKFQALGCYMSVPAS